MLKAELKVIEGKQQGKSIPLNVKKFLIGREQDCQLRPTSDLVSRHHCVFTQDDYTVRLRDLGSTNGTFVNGERVQGQVVLNDGDRIQIGKLAFQVLIRETADLRADREGAGESLSLEDLAAQPESATEEAAASLSDSAVLGSPETEFNAGKTEAGAAGAREPAPGGAGKTMEIPVFDQPAFATTETEPGMFGGDTTVIQPAQPGAASPLGPPQPRPRPPGAPLTPPGGFAVPVGGPVPPMYSQNPYAYPGVQQGYVPAPMYPAVAYPQAGYPMLAGYQPGYPQPAYPPAGAYPGMPYPQPPQAPAPPTESPSSAASKRAVPNPPVTLPAPETTGAKPPEPKPEEPKPADGSAPAKNPSVAAADIIRAHMRRPGT